MRNSARHEQWHPGLTLGSFNKLADERKLWLMLEDVQDKVEYNLRFQAFTASLLGPRVLYSPVPCQVHDLHNTITRHSKEAEVVGDVHAKYSLYSIHHRRSHIHRTVYSVLGE